MKIEHIAIWAQDLESLKEFYVKYFDATVGRKYQNTGIGKAALGKLLEEIKAHSRCKLVDVYYNPENLAAKKLYASHGFKEVGDRDDGTVIAEVNV